MADTAPVLVWMSGPDKLCTYFNKSWLDFTGRPLHRELGDGWSEGVHPDDRKRWQETYEPAFAGRQPFEIEFRLRRADGRFGSMICVGRPYHDMEGKFAGYLCSCYDNTARRASIAANSACAFVMYSRAVPAGITTPCHELPSKSLMPLSATLGKLGSGGNRSRVETAETLAAARGENWSELPLEQQDHYFDLAKENAE